MVQPLRDSDVCTKTGGLAAAAVGGGSKGSTNRNCISGKLCSPSQYKLHGAVWPSVTTGGCPGWARITSPCCQLEESGVKAFAYNSSGSWTAGKAKAGKTRRSTNGVEGGRQHKL